MQQTSEVSSDPTLETKPKGKKGGKKGKGSNQDNKSSTTVEAPVPEPEPTPVLEQDPIVVESTTMAPVSSTDGQFEMASSSTKEQIIENLQSTVKSLEFVHSISLKDIDLDKDFLKTYIDHLTKIQEKLVPKLITNSMTYMLKENVTSLKKSSKKKAKPATASNPEDKAINKKVETYPEILKFMDLPEGDKISKGELLRKITQYVKYERDDMKNTDIVVEGNKRLFKLVGKLNPLFKFIRLQMIERGKLTESDTFPTQLAYTQIMTYLGYAFHPKEKK
jgi:hypothetical protein